MTEPQPSDQPRVRVAFPAPAPAPEPGGRPEQGPEGRRLDGVALVTIDRPRVLNALDAATIDQLADAFESLDADPACRCIVLTGAGERAFAAGGDIREMAEESAAGLLASDRFARWERIARVRTPTIAAVRGYALGGGCELAMACDMIVAADDAVFGQPEVRLGIIPGAPSAVVSRENLLRQVLPAALDLAERIAAMPPLAVQAAVEAIDAAEELPLREGLAFERRLFYLLFATEDQTEGMRAFLEKRPATWQGR